MANGPTAYREFRIQVQDRSQVVAVSRQEPIAGEVYLAEPLAEQTLKVMSRLLANGRLDRREDLVLLGSHLYRVLFREEVHEAFLKAYDNARQHGLRVVLEFKPEAKDLAVWPWEYLYRPDDPKAGKGFFIAARSNLILSRHVPMTLPDDVWSVEDEVRILAVVSGPKGMTKVQSKPVLDELEQLTQVAGDKVRLSLLEQPVKRRFETTLKEFRPHIVHFIGHGTYEAGEGSLGFVDEETGEVTWIKDETVADCFESCNVRLVFIQACEGARSDSYDAFSGVALQLVYNRVPAVIAMRYEVQNKVAVAFAKTFYGAIREGKAIDEAVQKGRLELGKYLEEERNFSSRAFGCPVVYLQSVDMAERGVINFPQLEPPPEEDAAAGAATPEPGRIYLCPKPGCDTRINPERSFCPNPDCRTRFQICEGCREAFMADSGFCDACGWPHRSAAAQPAAEAPAAQRVERRATPRTPEPALPPVAAAKEPTAEKPAKIIKIYERG